MRPVVYLVCGVPGSGKSWVCSQLVEPYVYVPHDEHVVGGSQLQLRDALLKAAKSNPDRPLVTECPFAERDFKTLLEANGFVVKPYFVVERPDVVKSRYESRAPGLMVPQNVMTRATTILKRAQEWGAPFGRSENVLKALREAEK